MSNLSVTEMPLFESLFDMGSGYVLDFNNLSFKNFVYQTTNVDIDQSKYSVDGTSKAKRLREFIRIEPNQIVGKLLLSLIEYYYNLILTGSKTTHPQDLLDKCKAIVNKLLGKKIETEADLINYKFQDLPVNKLNIDTSIIDIVQQRIKEIEICLKYKATLACVLLCGSTLEGILLGIASKPDQVKRFNQSTCSPKDKEKKVRPLNEWTLNDLINVSHSIGIIDLNVKNFSHAIREFRNYIHPYQQMSLRFSPNIHTAELSWKVLQLAMLQLTDTKY